MRGIVIKSLSLLPPAGGFNLSKLFLLKRFSSKTNLSSGSDHGVIPSTQGSELGDDVSKEELKRRIEKFYEGDADAIPSIFEAILKRKLAGKHDESDNELLEEFGSKSRDDRDYDSE